MRFKNAIAIGGTHGKTTTTSLVAALLDAGDLDPTVINGGIINAYGTNAREGKGEWMVVEADESDGTFVKLPADVAVVTNIDPEHLDHYRDFDGGQAGLHQFRRERAVLRLCGDVPRPSGGAGAGRRNRGPPRHHLWPQSAGRCAAGRSAKTSTGTASSTSTSATASRMTSCGIEGLDLPMPGMHNALNATGRHCRRRPAEGAAEAIRKGLTGFTGVKRRFTKTGVVGGVTVIDDYGHHPVEIASVLRAARQSTRRDVIAVVQPHRYSRLHDLFDDFSACFNDADTVIVAPVYAGRRTAHRRRHP